MFYEGCRSTSFILSPSNALLTKNDTIRYENHINALANMPLPKAPISINFQKPKNEKVLTDSSFDRRIDNLYANYHQ